MKYAYTLTTPPAEEPIDINEAREHLRVDTVEDQVLIEGYIRGARSWVEKYIGRGLLTQTWTYRQDTFTDEIVLPMAAPLQSITAVKYYDTAGDLQTLASSYYVADTSSVPGRLRRAPDQVWPAIQSDRELGVEITYVVGWTSAALVPAHIKLAILLLVGDLYENGTNTIVGTISSELPMGAKALVAPERVFWAPPRCA